MVGTSFDLAGFVIAYENGELEEADIIAGFQHLIDTGLAWQLQGSYGRTAAALIENGLCIRPGAGPKCRSGECG